MLKEILVAILGLILSIFNTSKTPSEKVMFISPVPTQTSMEQVIIIPTPTEVPKDYSEYSFDNLAKKEYKQGEIKIGKLYKKGDNYSSYIFTYKSEDKVVSGLANIPSGNKKFPVIVLLHGWADKGDYYPGYGTEKSANFFAENGFLTLAPDFTGYGTSDWENADILAARFERPVEVLNLLSSISSMPSAESGRVGIWGHSNGGQIALSVLEITKKTYPTTLWAPVSLDFPECVLTYLGTEEVGNIVKERIDSFLILNDPKKFSVGPYLDKIKSPFIVHQADQDEYIEPSWTQNLVSKLKNQGLEVEYFTYPKENHNFNKYKATGETLRQRDLEFFNKFLK